ncbi:hypothetical protein AMTR_s00146p00080830 [Amborella trichopoda]|uniref:PHD-type domain-containing protein n=1 Tax=Amborella trichopoda TaxID=13333 RepID=W1PCU0_AMBTC|nr:hypothetical protein AMTR_s00146p00080830 [Amborella trichopoda]
MQSKGKLLEGEGVEVRQLEEGLRGSWYPGAILSVLGSKRFVRYNELLSKDGSTKLVESIPLKPSPRSLTFKTGALIHYRGRIRPLSPYSSTPPPEKLSFGICVDAMYQDAWWEGVVFDRLDGPGKTSVFFPDEGDELLFDIKDLRLAHDWDASTGEWRPRGRWLLIESLERYGQQEVLVSIKNIWYSLRISHEFLRVISEWTSGDLGCWSKLVDEVVREIMPGVQACSIVGFEHPVQDNLAKRKGRRPKKRKKLGSDGSKAGEIQFGYNGGDTDWGFNNRDCDSSFNGAEMESGLVSSVTLEKSASFVVLPEPISQILCGDEILSSQPSASLAEMAAWEEQPEIQNRDLCENLLGSKAHKRAIDKKNTSFGGICQKRRNGGTYRRCRKSKYEWGVVVTRSRYCSHAIKDYFIEYEKESKVGRAKCDIILAREQARMHLQAMGWRTERRLFKTRADLRYISPHGKAYYSFYTACLAFSKEGEGTLSGNNNDSEGSFGPLDGQLGNFHMGKGKLKSKRGCRKRKNGISSIDTPLGKVGSHGLFKNVRAGRGHERKEGDRVPLAIQVVENAEPDHLAKMGVRRRKKKHDKDGSSTWMGVKKRKKGHNDGCRMSVLPSKRTPQGLSLCSGKQSVRSVLSWMIENESIGLRQRVYYLNEKNGRVMAEGQISREGIRCKCCKVVYSLSGFGAHAGSRKPRPSAHIFLRDGRSLLQCQNEILTNKNINGLGSQSKVWRKASSRRNSDTICTICHYGGDLILCDHCPSSFHLNCVDLKEVPKGKWFCPSCRCSICGGSEYNDDTSQFTEMTVLFCDQCQLEYHVGCLAKNGEPRLKHCPQGNWFCSRKCSKIYACLHRLMGKKNQTYVEGLCITFLRSTKDDGGHFTASDIETIAEYHSKLSVALGILHECFEPIVEPRTKTDLVSDVLFNKWSELSRLDFRGFYTVVLEREDEMISVATIRVHGVKVAEMPLVATRVQYRRQGMCRLLVNEIEKMLASMGVEALMLPAVPRLRETWKTSFGFSEMSHSERLKLLEFTFLDFQDTTMCWKSLRKPRGRPKLIKERSITIFNNSQLERVSEAWEKPIPSLPCFDALISSSQNQESICQKLLKKPRGRPRILRRGTGIINNLLGHECNGASMQNIYSNGSIACALRNQEIGNWKPFRKPRGRPRKFRRGTVKVNNNFNLDEFVVSKVGDPEIHLQSLTCGDTRVSPSHCQAISRGDNNQQINASQDSQLSLVDHMVQDMDSVTVDTQVDESIMGRIPSLTDSDAHTSSCCQTISRRDNGQQIREIAINKLMRTHASTSHGQVISERESNQQIDALPSSSSGHIPQESESVVGVAQIEERERDHILILRQNGYDLPDSHFETISGGESNQEVGASQSLLSDHMLQDSESVKHGSIIEERETLAKIPEQVVASQDKDCCTSVTGPLNYQIQSDCNTELRFWGLRYKRKPKAHITQDCIHDRTQIALPSKKCYTRRKKVYQLASLVDGGLH